MDMLNNLPLAFVVVHEHHNALGQLESRHYEWRGDTTGVAIIDRTQNRTLRIPDTQTGDSFWLGDLHLLVVDFDFLYQRYSVMLHNGWAYQQMWLHRLCRLADLIYRRLILTAVVWGLAEWNLHDNELPGWRHLKCFRLQENNRL